MTWKLTPYAKTRTPLRGVKWADLTDAEYKAACKLHPGMEDRGYFVKAEEPKKPTSRTVAASSRTASIEATPAPPAEEETNG